MERYDEKTVSDMRRETERVERIHASNAEKGKFRNMKVVFHKTYGGKGK